MAAAAHFLIRKKLFNTKYPQLLVAKDFAVAEKNSISLSAEENTTQERKHLRKDIPQMLKQQIPNHQLHKINHKMNPSLNNSHKTNPSLNDSHKMSPSLNNSHKVHPPVNNNHKVKHPLVLNRNLFHHNSAMMIRFQIHGPWPEKLLPQKILALYQRNQNIVYNQKHITFNPLCLIFSLQIKRKMSYILKNSHIVTKSPNFLIYHLPKSCTCLKCISSLFSTNQTFN